MSTGLDGIPARVIHQLARELAPFLARLSRSILQHGAWPDSWKLHRLVPIHNRNIRLVRNNYQDIHVTDIQSKYTERLLTAHFRATSPARGSFR